MGLKFHHWLREAYGTPRINMFFRQFEIIVSSKLSRIFSYSITLFVLHSFFIPVSPFVSFLSPFFKLFTFSSCMRSFSLAQLIHLTLYCAFSTLRYYHSCSFKRIPTFPYHPFISAYEVILWCTTRKRPIRKPWEFKVASPLLTKYDIHRFHKACVAGHVQC